MVEPIGPAFQLCAEAGCTSGREDCLIADIAP
jgi:hypothetical protein